MEHRHVVLEAKLDIAIVIERFFTSDDDVGGLERKGLVAVGLRQFYPAMPVAMLHV